VSGDKDSYIPLDEGLSVISKHAREVLGYDAVMLMLDELVLWLANQIADSQRISQEAAKVSKLVESAEHERPAPIISFVPRQRDLRDLVRKDAYGVETTSLFDTLKYWDGRFDSLALLDQGTGVSYAACTADTRYASFLSPQRGESFCMTGNQYIAGVTVLQVELMIPGYIRMDITIWHA
jgi:hypothetical protein